MTRLCLIRHGQTDWNIEGRWQGHVDTPLNAVGLDQAQRVADELASLRLAAIYSSDLRRAFDTASIIAASHGLPVRIDPRLREQHLGAWEGQLLSEVPSLFPDSWEDRQKNPLDSRPPGGESIRQLAGRVIPAISAICAENQPHDQLGIVSHGLALAVFICHTRGRPLQEVFDCTLRNATPTFVDWAPE